MPWLEYSDLIYNPNFYVKLETSYPVLKQKHLNGYFSEIKLAMELSGVPLAMTLWFNLSGMLIIRTVWWIIFPQTFK